MAENIFDCQYFERCENSSKCYLCDDLRLLKLPKDKWNAKHRKRANKADSDWRGLEQQVADTFNAIPVAKSAYKALKRDKVFGMKRYDKNYLQIINGSADEVRGEGSYTIYQKELRKDITGKSFAKGFKFKNDDTTYVIIEHGKVADLVTHLKFLIDENIRFKEQLSTDDYQESIFPNLSESRRQIRSGAIWTMPGDVNDEIMLVEAKQRNGTNHNGEPKFAIKKKVIDKISNEASYNQVPALSFRMQEYGIYDVISYEGITELIAQLKFAYEENQLLQKEVIG